jgi:NAD(P)-dependent dehydrogenase (short-subunit alcohol dehydrogenase family)
MIQGLSLTPYGKRVLVTGSDRGIGLSAARAFAKSGCDVVLNYPDQSDRGEEESRRIIRDFGVRAWALKADLSISSQARQLVREAAVLLGGLDIVVCNAGICRFLPFLEVSDEEWLGHVGTNLNGSFYVSQEAAKLMVSQSTGGRIIMVTSVGAFRSNSTQTHYCATKGGQHLLMQGMALELAPLGILVNAVAPGWIHTEINDGNSSNPAVTGPWLDAHCPVGRLGTPQDLDSTFLLLASREASYINGATITIDGGWAAQL